MTAAAKATGLHSKLVAVMEAIGWIAKGGHNEVQKYDYTRQADVVNAIRAELVKQKVTCIAEDITVVETRDFVSAKGGRQHFLLVDVAYRFTDAESGESAVAHALGSGTDSGDKAAYKAATGASKYAALQTFLIPTGDDPEKVNDADGETRTPPATTAKRKPQVSNAPIPAAAAAAGFTADEVASIASDVDGGDPGAAGQWGDWQ